MFSLTKFPMAVIHSLNIVARTYGNWAHQWLTHPTPHPTTPCTVTSPFPSPPHLAPPPSPLTCLPGSQFICIITLHFICGTCMHACIKDTLRHVSYFHCRHVHYAIPAVTELYRHSIVLRYCRYMHSMCLYIHLLSQYLYIIAVQYCIASIYICVCQLIIFLELYIII